MPVSDEKSLLDIGVLPWHTTQRTVVAAPSADVRVIVTKLLPSAIVAEIVGVVMIRAYLFPHVYVGAIHKRRTKIFAALLKSEVPGQPKFRMCEIRTYSPRHRCRVFYSERDPTGSANTKIRLGKNSANRMGMSSLIL